MDASCAVFLCFGWRAAAAGAAAAGGGGVFSVCSVCVLMCLNCSLVVVFVTQFSKTNRISY